jgi:Ammonium Transporter Family
LILRGPSFELAWTSESVPPDLAQTVRKLKVALDTIWVLRTAFMVFFVGSSLVVGAIAGVLLVGAVLLFDRIEIDDPVRVISVDLVNGVFDTLCIGLLAQDLVPRMTGNGLSLWGWDRITLRAGHRDRDRGHLHLCHSLDPDQ